MHKPYLGETVFLFGYCRILFYGKLNNRNLYLASLIYTNFVYRLYWLPKLTTNQQIYLETKEKNVNFNLQ